MLFDRTIEEVQAGVRAFLDDPTRSGLLFRSPSDLEFQAAKFLAQWGTGEDDPEISFALGGTFSTADEFYREAAKGLGEVVAEIVSVLAETEVHIDAPSGPDWDGGPVASVEIRFAEYLEGVARAFLEVSKQAIFVLRFDDVLDVRGAGESLQRLGSALVCSSAKLVVLDDLNEPRFPKLLSTRLRAVQREFTIGSDPVSLFESFLPDPAWRVTELVCGDTAGDRLERGYFSEKARSAGAGGYFRVRADFRSRRQFCNAIYLVAKARFETVSDDVLPRNVYDMRAVDHPELSLTELLERIADTLFANGELVCIEIEPHEIRDDEEWRQFVRALRGAAISRRIRYVVLAESNIELPPADEPTVPWAIQEFSLPFQSMQNSLEAAMSEPDLEPKVRINHMIMLGGIYVAQRNFEAAIPMLGESVTMSEAEGTPEQKMNSWWNLANGLQRAGRYDLSENAFAEAANLAMDQANDVGAAQSFMGVGNARFMGEKYEPAIEAYDVAKKFWLAGGQTFGKLYADTWTAEAHRKLQAFEDSEKLFQEILKAYQELGEPFKDMAEQGIAEVYARLARLYTDIKKEPEARDCLQKAEDGGCQGVPEVPL